MRSKSLPGCHHQPYSRAKQDVVMAEAGIHIKARVALLPSAISGRTGPIRGGYRPNHNFGGPDDRDMDVGFLNFSDGQTLSPGESTEIDITLWPRPGLKEIVRSRQEMADSRRC
jgi:hypothetical protein